MPNLVGIGNSQVPTNAMLGGLAYQDPAHANLTEVEIENIAAIKAQIDQTAVSSGGSVFVYDTRKDSDGGAWRKRCDHTSWYNEGVNEFRGHRKEFPAVAVLVIENSGTRLTIYDGDDPNMPMWMIIPTIAGQQNMIAGFNDHDLITVTALNGIILVGTSPSWNHGNIIKVNFIKDDAVAICHTNDKKWTGGIINRNTDDYWQDIGSGNYIVTNHVNDVAMGVLPNAPIDDVTGLPIPTIAVACEGGISIFAEDGSGKDIVATSSGYVPAAEVEIRDSILYVLSGPRLLYTFRLPFNISTTGGSFSGYNGLVWISALQKEENTYSDCHIVTKKNKDLAVATPTDLLLVSPNYSRSTNNNNILENEGSRLNVGIGTDYNSGWMVGDIKGAWLADTDDTNVGVTTISADTLGSTNTIDGTFATSDGWTVNADWTIGSNVATCDGQNNGRFIYPSTDRWDIGTSVIVEVTVTRTAGTLSISYGTGAATSGTEMTADGTYYHVGEVTGNTLVYFRSDSFEGTIDNVKIYPAEADRSKNNKGIAVVGSITKTKVANGSNLVAYHGVSANNFLRQPYNADLNFGTNDFSLFVWVKKNTLSTNHYILDRAQTFPSWATGNRSYFIIRNTGFHRYRLAGGSEVSGSVRAMTTGVFNHIGFVRRSGTMEFWLNGEHVETITGSNASASFDNGGTNMTTTINRYANGFAHDYTFDRMALFRISGTAPLPEQVKKMYDDEKALFQPNTKCTLYGTSADIKGLGYDESNDIVYAGTSGGRSDFSGLKRINNTTTAVTTVISASNGLVAEQ